MGRRSSGENREDAGTSELVEAWGSWLRSRGTADEATALARYEALDRALAAAPQPPAAHDCGNPNCPIALHGEVTAMICGHQTCGVGGFVLEPLVHKRPADFRGGAPLAYRGYDRDPKTVILAKANMLIHLSELIESDPKGAVASLAPALNETFRAVGDRTIGTLANAPNAAFDLVMTNPPYVVSGTTQQKTMLASDPVLKGYYSTPSMGVEGLFIQLAERVEAWSAGVGDRA